MTARRPTLDDVAALAGVSRMVASRAVNGQSKVSSQAAERVHAAIRELGYVQHGGARAMATNRTGTIAFVAPMANHRFFADPNVAAVLGGIKQAISGGRTQLITLIIEDERDRAKASQYLQGRHVDGVIVLTPELVEPLVVDLCRAEIPVAANGVVDGAPGADSYLAETQAMATSMASALRSAGVRHCAVIAASARVPSTSAMIDGVRAAFPRLPERAIQRGDHSWQSGADAMTRILDQYPEVDGVFVASDVMASAALSVLAGRSIVVPDEVQVVGWDDSLPADACVPSLTTLHVPFADIGHRLASMLLERIEGERLVNTVETVTTSIICRDSTSARFRAAVARQAKRQ